MDSKTPAVLLHPFPVHHPSLLFLLYFWLVTLVRASPAEGQIRNEGKKSSEVAYLKSHLIPFVGSG